MSEADDSKLHSHVQYRRAHAGTRPKGCHGSRHIAGQQHTCRRGSGDEKSKGTTAAHKDQQADNKRVHAYKQCWHKAYLVIIDDLKWENLDVHYQHGFINLLDGNFVN